MTSIVLFIMYMFVIIIFNRTTLERPSPLLPSLLQILTVLNEGLHSHPMYIPLVRWMHVIRMCVFVFVLQL